MFKGSGMTRCDSFEFSFWWTTYPDDNGADGDDYAVDADNYNNPNPVKSTVLVSTFHITADYIAMVS